MAEFDGLRAQLYEEALSEFPNARRADIKAMQKLLYPQSGEKILGVGEGNGYFARSIAEAVGEDGEYYITDPSQDQLTYLRNKINLSQIRTEAIGAEELDRICYDKVWSFGAFHHCSNQTEAMKRIYKALKPDGLLVLCDVFQGSDLARHFDSQVARYCVTGHEVKFLSDEFARTLCHLAGFENVQIKELQQKWEFEKIEDIGKFIYKLHGMTNLVEESENYSQTLAGCMEMLGVEYENGVYKLKWPMKVILARK